MANDDPDFDDPTLERTTTTSTTTWTTSARTTAASLPGYDLDEQEAIEDLERDEDFRTVTPSAGARPGAPAGGDSSPSLGGLVYR